MEQATRTTSQIKKEIRKLQKELKTTDHDKVKWVGWKKLKVGDIIRNGFGIRYRIISFDFSIRRYPQANVRTIGTKDKRELHLTWFFLVEKK